MSYSHAIRGRRYFTDLLVVVKGDLPDCHVSSFLKVGGD